MKLRIFIYTALTFVLFSCQKSKVDPVAPTVIPTGLPPQTSNDVAYGLDVLQKFDMYLPANRTTTKTKVLILVHGGGWVGGDKADLALFLNTIKQKLPDYAIFNVNYKLAAFPSSNPFPTQELDVKAAVNFIFNNKTTYNISEKFVLLGVSAGGHLSLLQAYKNASPKIYAVVDLYGPTDLVDGYNNPASSAIPPAFIGFITTGMIGGNPTNSPAAFAASSPINQVTIFSPPTIIFQGGLDTLVRPSQSASLRARLLQAAVVNQYVFYPNEGHAYLGSSLDDTFEKTVAFLNANVQ
jgi:acetyl esterase/lipase